MRNMLRGVVVGACLLFVCGVADGAAATSPTPPPPVDERAPLPTDAERRRAERAVDEAFGGAIHKARGDEAAVVGRAMLKTAGETDGTAARLVLLERATALASRAGDIDTLTAAARAVAAGYRVDGFGYPADTLARASREAPADARLDIAYALLDLHRDAATALRFDEAARIAQLAYAEARRARDLDLARAARDAQATANRLALAWREVADAHQTLQADPHNPAANAAVGAFYAFELGDAGQGLPLLAKGDDEALAELAQLDIAAPPEPGAKFTLADRWDQWSETQPAGAAAFGRDRALSWYAAALPDLEGLQERLAVKRIARLERLLPNRAAGKVRPGDLALASAGATATAEKNPEAAIDGSLAYTGSAGFAHGTVPTKIDVDLGDVYLVRDLRVLLWSGDDRTYRYVLEASADGKRFTTLADHRDKPSSGWQKFTFRPRPIKTIRIRGLANTANQGFHVVEVQAYAVSPEE